MNIELMLTGCLFLIIIITNLISDRFGYETISRINGEKILNTINQNQSQFKIAYAIILIEHISIIVLAFALFIAFSSHNLILAIIWAASRTAEGTLQIVNKVSYWKLLDLAKSYESSSAPEKTAMSNAAGEILEKKNRIFTYAQILFSIGTFAYAITFILHNLVPALIAWLGLVSAVLYGLGNGIKLSKPNSHKLWDIGGGLVLLFEISLGVWLIYHSMN